MSHATPICNDSPIPFLVPTEPLDYSMIEKLESIITVTDSPDKEDDTFPETFTNQLHSIPPPS